MTLCIGIEKKGRIWIGADCGSSDEEGWTIRAKEPKVWVSNGWVLGAAGNWEAIRALRIGSRFRPPPSSPHLAESMMLEMAQEMRRVFNQYDVPHESEDDALDILMGAKGAGLWEFDRHQCAAQVKGEVAIGVADKYALGWLDGSSISDPKTRISECIKATNKRNPTIIGPAKIIEAGFGEIEILEEDKEDP